jgi:dTDP-4-dehydrorhamnose 3,5-epimerase
MKITGTAIHGAYLIELEPVRDERGSFLRTWCVEEYARHGLDTTVAQCSTAFNAKKGTLRGMHYQAQPFQETKTIRCIQGSLYDVFLDVRPASPSYKQWVGLQLRAGDHRMLYVPEGVAHGYQTLEDNTEVSYLISKPYSREHARGIRWDDPAFAIRWMPMEELIISGRDRQFRPWEEEQSC